MSAQKRKPPYGILIIGLSILLAATGGLLWYLGKLSEREPQALGYRVENAGRTLVIVVDGVYPNELVFAKAVESQSEIAVAITTRPPLLGTSSGGMTGPRDVRLELDQPVDKRTVLYGSARVELQPYP